MIDHAMPWTRSASSQQAQPVELDPPAIGGDRKRIAIVTSFFRHGQWRGIMRYGQIAGWICQRHNRDTLDRLIAWNPDGILYQIDEYDTPLLDYVRQARIPRVGLRALPEGEEETPLILPDLAHFGRIIAEHLRISNYRRICYLGPALNQTANAGNTHEMGLREVAASAGLSVECIHPDAEESWTRLGLSYQSTSHTGWDRFWELGPALIRHLLASPEPVGLFSAYVEPAMELMEMVEDAPIPIPSRIGMAAQTEDALNGTVTKVPLTCLVPDYEEQGYEAAALLDQILSGISIPPHFRKFIQSSEFIARASSNQIVTSDPLLRKMLLHLQLKASDPHFCPNHLAEAFGYSLRSIQMRFHKAIGRGVAEVIRDYRTRRAIEMIRSTKLTMQEIVSTCGFSNHHQLARAIRRETGSIPSAIRKADG
jgi:LacI family transcriptional regulator